jgi:light-regulated signal transduction histidine kinase (bacteriophytochrome)
MIDDLLKLSSVTRADLHRIQVDVGQLSRRVLETLQQADPDRHVRLMVAESIVVSADRNLLLIVLENLLGNAWKFTSKSKEATIEVGLHRDRGNPPVCIVRDNGAGFDPQGSGDLFAAFQRFHRQEEFPGTGVGLATVKRIIDRHGGRIWAESTPGRGATFYFTVGSDPQPSPVSRPPASVPANQPGLLTTAAIAGRVMENAI